MVLKLFNLTSEKTESKICYLISIDLVLVFINEGFLNRKCTFRFILFNISIYIIFNVVQ